MIEILGLAFALGMGVGWPRLILLAAAIYWPVPTLTIIGIARARFRPERPSPVAFCDGVAAELRAGSSLRSAVAASAAATNAHELAEAARSSVPMGVVGRAARAAFPEAGEELALAITEIARSGSGGADLIDEIGTLALAQQEVAREIRVASAPARATAALFLIGPSAYLLIQAHSGSLASLLASSGQRITAVAGLGLFLVGLVVAGAILWRAR